MRIQLASRRGFLSGMAALGFGSIFASTLWARVARSSNSLKLSMLLPGQIDDGGFMEAGYRGLLRIEHELQASVSYIDRVQPQLELLTDALRKLAAEEPDLMIAHGGQNSEATALVAPEFPDIKFIVVQGNAIGSNLSSYEVLQEQSAWLGGALAGLLTQSQVVGHISGIRVTPGLKGRGAFADGLRYTNSKARFLTNFCGSQDDAQRAKQVALAEIDAGADIIFTMLNAGRIGAIEACRERGVLQIGNVVDWYPIAPDVFIASAIADVSIPGFLAAEDFINGSLKLETKRRIGLDAPEAVRLAMAPSVPLEIQTEVEALAAKIVAGAIEVSTCYEGGEEFEA